MNNKVLGIIGGGQLAMMICEAAKNFSVKTIVLDPNSKCSASKICDNFIKGEYNDKKALDSLFSKCDYITYEFENINLDVLNQLNNKYNKCIPSVKALYISQDRLKEKIVFNNLGIRTASFFNIETKEDIYNAINILKAPCILKTRFLGYDGKGQYTINSIKDIDEKVLSLIGKEKLILEKKVDFVKEISIIGGFINNSFEIVSCNENIHKNGILFRSETCKSKDLIKKSSIILKKYLEEINIQGIMTIEFFVNNKDELIVNETAPRVHNSGHHTLNSHKNSQFDFIFYQILNKKWDQKFIKDFIMFNLIGNDYKLINNLEKIHKSICVKDYLKEEIKENRKMAHINVPSDEKLISKVEKLLGK